MGALAMDDRPLNIRDFKHIRLTSKAERITLGDVVKTCETLKQKYHNERQTVEQQWKDAWAAYLTTPEATQYAESRTIDVVGNVDANWRHKLHTAKAFETVETIVSYLQSSFFPNQKWFDFEPRIHIPNPDWKQIVEANRKFVDLKLDGDNFRSKHRQYLREMCITGTAGLSMPWRTEVKDTLTNTVITGPGGEILVVPRREVEVTKHSPELKVMSVLDFYLDPEIDDPNRSNLIRRFVMSRGDLINLIESKKYPLARLDQIRRDSLITDNLRDESFKLNLMVGITAADSLDGTTGNVLLGSSSGNQNVELFEFWGDIVIKNIEFKDVQIVWSGRHVLLFNQNPYWSGKPFQFGTYIGITGTPYGIGALQPVLSDLYQQNILMSRRADNISVNSDSMYTVLADGVTDISEVYTAPGHVIPVTTHDAIQPLQLTTDQSLSVQEQGILEQIIDKAAGTGPFIGVGAGRAAERVTAEEIQAQRDAGGNRLNGVYSHIEETSMIPFLQKYRELLRQFIVSPEPMMMQMGSFDIEVVFGPDLLQFPMSVKALGAGHISDKEFELRQLTQWIQLVMSIEGFASLIGESERLAILQALTEKMIPDLANKVIPSLDTLLQRNQDNQQLLAQQQEALVSPAAQAEQQLQDSAQFVGGQPAVNAIQEGVATGQSEQQLQAIAEALRLN